MSNFHELLQRRYKNFHELEENIEQLKSSSEKGEVFEQFVYAYLNNKKNLYQLKKVFR